MPGTFDWNSIPDPGGIANNRPRGSNCSGDLSNKNYDVIHGLIPLAGGVLSAGDVFKFVGTSNASLTNGSFYAVLSINIYTFTPCTVTTTFAAAPDSVTLTGGVIVSVDYLLTYFSRTTIASAVSPYGRQIPPTLPAH
jgi:hypothetical protein